ncbi:hypothetical protein L6452_28002 [Arctium lappa]|uniref:Uncharacterized protein n=1 Tax=Arctium lappa TaxID=4217 RepID=A0ACB8ZWB4_ARCLA|nr:hypothetical protein L6452_28002 [Arctium lappa]
MYGSREKMRMSEGGGVCSVTQRRPLRNSREPMSYGCHAAQVAWHSQSFLFTQQQQSVVKISAGPPKMNQEPDSTSSARRIEDEQSESPILLLLA